MNKYAMLGTLLSLSTLFIAETAIASEIKSQVKSEVKEVKIENAWIRSAPPTATVLAGYMMITNTSNEKRILQNITSPKFEAVEIHQSIIDSKGMAKMKKLDTLEIAPQASIHFEPSSYHLMLIHPKGALGSSVDLVLQFDNGEVNTNVKIQAAPHNPQMEHHHH